MEDVGVEVELPYVLFLLLALEDAGQDGLVDAVFFQGGGIEEVVSEEVMAEYVDLN